MYTITIKDIDNLKELKPLLLRALKEHNLLIPKYENYSPGVMKKCYSDIINKKIEDVCMIYNTIYGNNINNEDCSIELIIDSNVCKIKHGNVDKKMTIRYIIERWVRTLYCHLNIKRETLEHHLCNITDILYNKYINIY